VTSSAEFDSDYFDIRESTAASSYRPLRQEHADSVDNSRPGRSLRTAEQAYFWTERWQQGEKLADYDYVAGADYEPADVDDLIRWLNED
jgi:hypothetical protein